MAEKINLEEHIAKGVEKIVTDTLKATMKDPRESAFMVKFAAASRKATKTRLRLAEEGEHIPSFLIASITSSCNLHCAGCYSRCNEATVDAEPVQQLTGEEWLKVFREAEKLGVSFIMLAGGEPMLRWDIIEAAGTMQNILFPVFTNGTYMNERYLKLFDKCRNLIPVMSIEGGRGITDERADGGCMAAAACCLKSASRWKLCSRRNRRYDKGWELLLHADVRRRSGYAESSQTDGAASFDPAALVFRLRKSA